MLRLAVDALKNMHSISLALSIIKTFITSWLKDDVSVNSDRFQLNPLFPASPHMSSIADYLQQTFSILDLVVNAVTTLISQFDMRAANIMSIDESSSNIKTPSEGDNNNS